MTQKEKEEKIIELAELVFAKNNRRLSDTSKEDYVLEVLNRTNFDTDKFINLDLSFLTHEEFKKIVKLIYFTTLSNCERKRKAFKSKIDVLEKELGIK